MKSSRYIIFIGSLILLIFVGTSGCSIFSKTDSRAVVIATATSIPPRTLTEARVVPAHNAALSFPTPGIVDEVLIPEGTVVKAGEVIARMKGIDRARAAIAQAEMLKLTAQKDMDDFDDKSKISTADAELLLAKARIELNNARDARKSLDYQQV